MKLHPYRASALTLFVACIAGTDDPDFAVTFDDLAEFASAFHRRSDFHFTYSLNNSFKSVKSLLLSAAFVFLFFMFLLYKDTKNPRNHPSLPKNGRAESDAAQTKLVIVLRQQPDTVRAVE